jgi:hypothetical protein
MCQSCQRPALGSVYCEEHAPVPTPQPTYAAPVDPAAPPPLPQSTVSPWTAPAAPGGVMPDPSVHPVLALILGFLPGVGAIYNGQYAKGLIHAVIFGLMVSVENITSNGALQAFVGIMIGAWVIYQAFEAYHTARKRRYGIPVEELSSFFDARTPGSSRSSVGALILIGAGVVLLLETTDIIGPDILERYWPLALIAGGVWLLYSRMNTGAKSENGAEVRR